jgi:uncharacterized membrane protein
VTKSPTPTTTADRLSQGAIIEISIGTAAFVFAILGVIILARCKNRCEPTVEREDNVVPIGMLISSDAAPTYINE